jgi:hypothetical protein
MRIAIATCAALPPQFDDDRRLIEALTARGVEAVHAMWDDPADLFLAFSEPAADRLAAAILAG